MGFRLGTGFVLFVTASFVAMGCGQDPAPEAPADSAAASQRQAKKPSKVATADNSAPVIDRIRFEPEEPVPGQPLRARVEARDADGDEIWFDYVWRIDGRDAGDLAAGQDLDLRDAVKGQSIEVVVVASDGQDESRPYSRRVDLENRPPEIVEVDLEPGREVVTGTPVVVFPSGSDPDGDPLEYRYQWSVNQRELSEDGALLETGRMRRGDEIRVRVIANDGEVDSEPVELPPVVVSNAPPRIVSSPPGDLDGGVFRYAVSAQDPDGDPHLEYRLEGAPAGMRIDPYSGLVTWTPAPEQSGLHSVTVFAQDLHDGVGEQVFEVRVRAPEGSQDAAVADAGGAEPDFFADEEPEVEEPGFFAEDEPEEESDFFADEEPEEDEGGFFDDEEEGGAPAEVAP